MAREKKDIYTSNELLAKLKAAGIIISKQRLSQYRLGLTAKNKYRSVKTGKVTTRYYFIKPKLKKNNHYFWNGATVLYKNAAFGKIKEDKKINRRGRTKKKTPIA